MAKRNYERLDIVEFGTHLLTTGDLDPVYIALARLRDSGDGGMNENKLRRWLIAYWCLYHCGAASFIAEHEGNEFWDWLLSAARNDNDDSARGSRKPPIGERWPRGHERRHFRGAQGNNAVCELQCKYGDQPGKMIDAILGYGHVAHGDQLTFKGISDRTCKHYLFGPWIGFKVADMVDRVLGVPVDFDEAAVFMFKDPMKSALMQWRLNCFGSVDSKAEPKDKGAAIHAVVEHLREKFAMFTAPPFADRPVGVQEVETVLCKWKSHYNGHYPLNNDINDIVNGMAGWDEVSDLGRAFTSAMPKRSTS